MDYAFKSWISKEAITFYTLTEKGKLKDLRRKCHLEKSDFFLYLQVHNYFGHNIICGQSSSGSISFVSLLQQSKTCILLEEVPNVVGASVGFGEPTTGTHFGSAQGHY